MMTLRGGFNLHGYAIGEMNIITKMPIFDMTTKINN